MISNVTNAREVGKPKEAWEMDFSEFLANNSKYQKQSEKLLSQNNPLYNRTSRGVLRKTSEIESRLKRKHKEEVETAYSKGYDVPKWVLREYGLWKSPQDIRQNNLFKFRMLAQARATRLFALQKTLQM